MYPIIKVTEVDSGTATLPRRRYGASKMISVSPMALTWHAINTGGALPPAASWLSRLMFRISCATALWSFVEARDGEWRATELYRQIETSDKGQASYRIGTIMAGVAGHRELQIFNLIHRQTQFGPSSSSRADFVGRRRSDGSWHGVEAKGRGPVLSTGSAPVPTPKELNDARA